MAAAEKQILYDWMGGNVWLFKQINQIKGDIYDKAMIAISAVTDNNHFPYYVAFTVAIALLDYALRKIQKRGGAQNRLIAWFGAVSVFVAAAIISTIYIHNLKDSFAYQRP